MKNKKHTPLLAALATLVMLLAGVVLIWLAKVRPDVGKGRSEIVTDFLRAELLQDGQTATQVFTYDKDILTIGLEFYLPGDQPCGALDVVLYDADTGEELSRSVGTMDYIVPDQYTTLGMDPAVTGQEGRRYKLAVTPHYATDAILAIGHSDGVALWKEQMAVDDRVIDGTMAMQITYQRIGGYLTRFFLLVGGLAAVLTALAVWAVLSKKLALHRLVFVLVLGFGLLYSFVLPPYAAPDEKYHINQSFTLACRWANDLSHDEWQMGKVPTTTSFRRVGDEDADLQNENTTVFTWEAFTSQLFTTTDQPFDSHQEYNELQTAFRRLQTWFRRKICSSPRKTLFLTDERPFPHRGTKASTTGNFKNDYSSQIFPSSISTKPFLFPDIDSSSFSILSGKNAISVSGWKYCFKNVG